MAAIVAEGAAGWYPSLAAIAAYGGLKIVIKAWIFKTTWQEVISN